MMSNNLYLCDPVKNTFCPKTHCHNPCYHTHDPECAWEPTLPVRLDPGAYLPQRAHEQTRGWTCARRWRPTSGPEAAR